MANIDYIEGGYTVSAGATQTFDFWWPGGGKAKEYFDVSIAPSGGTDEAGNPVSPHLELRLRERKREMLRVFDAPTNQTRYILRLTIENEDTKFDVDFIANHTRIY